MPCLTGTRPQKFLAWFYSRFWSSSVCSSRMHHVYQSNEPECADATKQDTVRRRFKDLDRKSDGRSIYIYKTVVSDRVLTLNRLYAYPSAVLRHASGPTGPRNSSRSFSPFIKSSLPGSSKSRLFNYFIYFVYLFFIFTLLGVIINSAALPFQRPKCE